MSITLSIRIPNWELVKMLFLITLSSLQLPPELVQFLTVEFLKLIFTEDLWLVSVFINEDKTTKNYFSPFFFLFSRNVDAANVFLSASRDVLEMCLMMENIFSSVGLALLWISSVSCLR